MFRRCNARQWSQRLLQILMHGSLFLVALYFWALLLIVGPRAGTPFFYCC